MSRIDYDLAGKKIKVDVKDKKILDLLSEDSRMPVTMMSKKVGLSRDATNYRIKRLENLGVVEKFVPRLDFRKLGYKVFHIFFLVDESKNVNDFIEYMKNMPETLFLFEYSDSWDFELVMIAKDIYECDKVITSLQAEFSDTIMERGELLEINTYQSILFSYFFNKDLHLLNKGLEDNPDVVKVDDKDMKILTLLSENSRQSTYDMTKGVDLSADAIGLRIKKLKKEGVIRKFTIVPELTLLGYNWYTFCIKMRKFDVETEKKFRAFVEHHPGVIRAAKTFGDWDVMMYIIAESPKDFHYLIKDIKKTFADIVSSYSTILVYKEHVFKPIPDMLKK